MLRTLPVSPVKPRVPSGPGIPMAPVPPLAPVKPRRPRAPVAPASTVNSYIDFLRTHYSQLIHNRPTAVRNDCIKLLELAESRLRVSAEQ